MNRKTLGIGFVLLVLAGCASVPLGDPVEIYQRTRSYKKYSFDDVWSAALRSVDDIGFVVRNSTKKVGLIRAVAKNNPDSRHLPPVMNVVIREEDRMIDVNFHIELPGQRDESGMRRSYSNRFFKALRRNLK